MHLNLSIDYNDLVTIVKQLPVSKLKKLNHTINNEIDIKKKTTGIDLQTLILNAPTCTDKEYDDYLIAREHINKSRIA